ncbi:MFS transporter [Acidobacterium sp. S8]|uniref:MFS transporter n=1 Tax=Acidobacterium sp. S8 TaxID=1641854 RepID=UPI00131B711A|nr:MFS transporter [Acidobacterium sp. S8]
MSNRYSKWLVVALLWMVACLNYMDRMAVFAIFPILQREMHLSNVSLAMLGSVFLWMYGLCSPLGGYLGDRFPRKPVILCSLLIFSAVTLANGTAQSQIQLLTLRVLLGISEALFLPAAVAHIASFHSNSTRSLANALVLTGLPAGAGLGGFYSGFMAEHFSWRIGFYLLGVFGFLLCLVLWILLPTGNAATTQIDTNTDDLSPKISVLGKMAGVLHNRASACLIFMAFALSLSSWPSGSWLPTYFYERFHMSLTRAGFILALITYIPAIAGGLFGGLLADRFAKKDANGRISVQIAALTFMAPTMLAVGFLSSVQVLSANLLLYSFARGSLEVNSMPIFSSRLPSDRWATAYGLYNLSGTIAGSIGILFVGYFKTAWGIGMSLSCMSLLLFAAIWVMRAARDTSSQVSLSAATDVAQ